MILIDKAELINKIAANVHYDTEHGLEAYAKLLAAINNAPEVDPVRHGKWIWVEDVPLEDGQTEYDRESFYQCSECDAYDLRLKDCHADYCWSCGAKMDLDEVKDNERNH